MAHSREGTITDIWDSLLGDILHNNIPITLPFSPRLFQETPCYCLWSPGYGLLMDTFGSIFDPQKHLGYLLWSLSKQLSLFKPGCQQHIPYPVLLSDFPPNSRYPQGNPEFVSIRACHLVDFLKVPTLFFFSFC